MAMEDLSKGEVIIYSKDGRKESGSINKTIYNNINLIINFCNKLPDIYLNSDIERKREILRLLINKMTYSYKDRTLKATLNPIFEAFRIIKITT